MSAQIPGPQQGDGLLLIDVQNDFLPGGALAVADGDAVLEPLSRCAAGFAARQLPIFATRDWHPPDHCSFRAQGGPWPPHCVAGSVGAEPPAGLRLPSGVSLVRKAVRRESEAYSGFEGTELGTDLARRRVRRLFVGGLATDYCVRATVCDALAAGFGVIVLEDAIRAVSPESGAAALRQMLERGATLARSRDLGF